ncbi:hypothetical protein SDC9_90261 [bioreactor metagenome]|uniref:Uncharacterized protein n=1 Tax=bioreactor metagenome TaxID=1076179 RepID=A0A645A188_9ZZZZ
MLQQFGGDDHISGIHIRPEASGGADQDHARDPLGENGGGGGCGYLADTRARQQHLATREGGMHERDARHRLGADLALAARGLHDRRQLFGQRCDDREHVISLLGSAGTIMAPRSSPEIRHPHRGCGPERASSSSLEPQTAELASLDRSNAPGEEDQARRRVEPSPIRPARPFSAPSR